MNLQLDMINWLAVAVCFVVGQIYLTVWFTALFGEPWAKAYDPAKTKAEHTKEVPPYTYAIGAVCTFLLILGIAILQQSLALKSIGEAVTGAAFLSICIVLATTLPGYAFLRRWQAFKLAAGSQLTLIFIVSIILAAWPK